MPGVKPVKLRGVTYDHKFNFSPHIAETLETCERYLRLVAGMSHIVKAEKLKVLYIGLILSRLQYGLTAWYPYARAADKAKLESLHRRACCVITGCVSNSDGLSVCYEAGFRSFDALATAETIKIADQLRRAPAVPSAKYGRFVFGPEWVTCLFRDGALPTATPRKMTSGVSTRNTEQLLWPAADTVLDSPVGSLRHVGKNLNHGDPRAPKRHDWRQPLPSLRPLPRIHPWAPQDLRQFDDAVTFMTCSPGGLVKPDGFNEMTAAEKAPFAAANAARMEHLRANNPGALYAFTDGARRERGLKTSQRSAGAFVVCEGDDPNRHRVLEEQAVITSPIACTYTTELMSIGAVLRYVLDNRDQLYSDCRGRRRLCLVTDSKSSLESVRTTWLRRINFLEQDVCRLLHDLACAGVYVTLAFVFSHTEGGAPGNDYVDAIAEQALQKHGDEWCDSLWNVDTTRELQHAAFTPYDNAARNTGAFRFRTAPRYIATSCGAPQHCRRVPSGKLPREIPRAQERLLYRARLGMFTPAGGSTHDSEDACPLCQQEGELGRDGATLLHVRECIRSCTVPPIRINLEKLWTEPVAMAAALSETAKIVKAHTT